jgi:hypothetical protein
MEIFWHFNVLHLFWLFFSKSWAIFQNILVTLALFFSILQTIERFNDGIFFRTGGLLERGYGLTSPGANAMKLLTSVI